MRAIVSIVALLLVGCTPSDQPLWSGWPLAQRSEMPIPGLGGEVLVSIGDIRNGATATLYVSSQWGQNLAQKVAMRPGDSVRFEHLDERYVVTLLRYDDGALNDYAYLRFSQLTAEPD